MPTAAYVDDIHLLTNVLLANELAAGTPTLSNDATLGDDEDLFISVYVGSDSLRPAVAFQQVLQMAVDVAAVLVDAFDEVENAYLTAPIDREFVARALREPSFELTIVRLSNGSWYARFSFNPKKKSGRARILAVASFAVAVVGLIVPPVGVVATIAVPALYMINEVATPDDLPLPPPLQTVDPTELAGASEVQVTVEVDKKAA
ncbi:hypothetical protein ACE2AJ_18720 [Aquihabitans daechungensis]|uniref:hypothetical protein n=1 Tax=Aquihabitans daechungensis TaxID=1052257 RepID=UPI003BA0EBCB